MGWRLISKQGSEVNVISRTRSMRSLLTSCSLFSVIVGTALELASAASPVSSDEAKKATSFVFAQSKDVELPEDFLVRVDGNKLHVTLESLGIIDSRRSTANLLVRLLDSNGNEKTATSNAQGDAEFSDVNDDELYALVVADKNVHGVIPLMTVSNEKATEKGIVSTRIRFPLMEANQTEILTSINRDIPPRSDVAGSLYTLEDYNLQGLNLYRVRLQSDGTLLGRVIVADRDLAESLRYAKLTFFRNNQVVARTDSSASDGSFSVANLDTGIHGVIAAGPAGYSAFAFDVLPPKVDAGEAVIGLPVSFLEANPSEKLFVFLVPPKMVDKVTDRVREAYALPTNGDTEPIPLAGQPGFGGGGGGFGGGSSGGGGGGGLGGGIGGIAGLAAIAAVVASSNNDNNSNNLVVSPITSQ